MAPSGLLARFCHAFLVLFSPLGKLAERAIYFFICASGIRGVCGIENRLLPLTKSVAFAGATLLPVINQI